jgi:hypothetical protein
MMSDEILFQDADNNFIRIISALLMVYVFVPLPNVIIENKKVYSQVTTDKEHKKLMKVLYPKTTKLTT